MKNVVLLGDSIRMCYQPKVKALLTGKAEVFAPGENCRFAKYTHFNLREWLPAYPKPDVIHWNNGLWDNCLRYNNMPFTPINEYLRDMSSIFDYLYNTGAKVVFATTTPVSDLNTNWNNSIIRDYNTAILNIFKGKDIVINDLYSVVDADKFAFICDDLCHLSQKGIDTCGSITADIITSLF